MPRPSSAPDRTWTTPALKRPANSRRSKAPFSNFRAIGVAHPSHDLVTVSLKRALMAALRALPLKLDVVPVGERYSFASLTEGWSKGAERAASVLAADSPASNKAA